MGDQPQVTSEMDPPLASGVHAGGYRRLMTGDFHVAAESVRAADQFDACGDLCHLAFRSTQRGFCRIGADKLD